MIKKLLILKVFFVFAFLSVAPMKQAKAASDLDCGIWICLPGGFPAGCGPYYARFLWRIHRKRRLPPLVPLGSCAGLAAAELAAAGIPASTFKEPQVNYGREDYYECKENYSLFIIPQSRDEDGSATCRNNNNACQTTRGRDDSIDRSLCNDYPARERTKKNYVDIKFEGRDTQRFYY